jgi:hypothetical protein
VNLRHIDITSAMRRLAERRIEQAIAEGKFDHLAGAGKPLDLEPMPAQEDARLKWWALRLLRQNGVVPDEVRLRKQVEQLRERLGSARDETQVVGLVAAINSLVRKINTLGTNALSSPVSGVCLEVELRRLRDSLELHGIQQR